MTANVLSRDFTPKYVKIAKLFKDKIINGELEEKSRLPTNRELARSYSVSLQTANKALKLLAKQQLIISTTGNGTYVSYRKEEVKCIRKVALIGTAFSAGFRSRDPYFMQLVSGIYDFFLNNNIVATNISTDVKSFFKEYNDNNIEGVVFSSPNKNLFPLIDKLHKAQIPYVVISGGKAGMNRINSDNRNGARKGVEHLLSLKHSRVAFVGLKNMINCAERLKGYKDALKKYRIRLDPKLIHLIQPGDKALAESLNKLFQLKIPPTALFGAGFHQTLKSYKFLVQKKICIPDDISLLGFDDHELVYNYLNPTITAVKQNVIDLGFTGAKMLYEQMVGNRNSEKEVVLPTELIQRESCSNPKGTQ